MSAAHWRRPLRDGGVEFYFRAGDSKMQGSVHPAEDCDVLQGLFEQQAGVSLPPAELKQPRGAT